MHPDPSHTIRVEYLKKLALMGSGLGLDELAVQFSNFARVILNCMDEHASFKSLPSIPESLENLDV